MSNWKLVEQNLPRRVLSRWILGNTVFPSVTLPPLTDKISEKRMIVVEGGHNTGKTTAIVSVFAALVHNLFPFQEIDYDFLAGATISRGCDDFMAIVNVNPRRAGKKKFRIGFWSAGDQKLDQNFEDILIKDAACDIIVCAATKKPTAANPSEIFDKLEKLGDDNDYKVEKIHCLYVSWLSSKLSLFI